MRDYNNLSDKEYKKQRLEVMIKEEGLKKSPYIDSVGIPTIGIGFNLRQDASFNAVLGVMAPTLNKTQRNELKAIINQHYTAKQIHLLQSHLDDKMKEYNAANSSIPRKFAFAADRDVENTFNNLVNKFESDIDHWLNGIPQSQERVALFSLAWAGSKLLGSGLRDAIREGNRAKAWYEIRYNSNGGASKSPGIAKRRYYESHILGLYKDSGNVSKHEAQNVDEMYEQHKKNIDDYEALYSGQINTARRDYGVNVESLEDSIKPAIDALVKTKSPVVTINNGSDYNVWVKTHGDEVPTRIRPHTSHRFKDGIEGFAAPRISDHHVFIPYNLACEIGISNLHVDYVMKDGSQVKYDRNMQIVECHNPNSIMAFKPHDQIDANYLARNKPQIDPIYLDYPAEWGQALYYSEVKSRFIRINNSSDGRVHLKDRESNNVVTVHPGKSKVMDGEFSGIAINALCPDGVLVITKRCLEVGVSKKCVQIVCCDGSIGNYIDGKFQVVKIPSFIEDQPGGNLAEILMQEKLGGFLPYSKLDNTWGCLFDAGEIDKGEKKGSNTNPMPMHDRNHDVHRHQPKKPPEQEPEAPPEQEPEAPPEQEPEAPPEQEPEAPPEQEPEAPPRPPIISIVAQNKSYRERVPGPKNSERRHYVVHNNSQSIREIIQPELAHSVTAKTRTGRRHFDISNGSKWVRNIIEHSADERQIL